MSAKIHGKFWSAKQHELTKQIETCAKILKVLLRWAKGISIRRPKTRRGTQSMLKSACMSDC